MATATVPAIPKRSRQALGLPAGSVRAILSLSILGLSWLLVLFAPKGTGDVRQVPMEFIYLQLLMILILGHYFTARITPPAEGESSALGLPRGTVRFLIVLAYGGLAYYLYHQSRELTYDFRMTGNQILFVGLMFLGFILGHYFTLITLWFIRPSRDIPGWVLDIQAWFAIIAMGGLLVVLLITLVINPGVAADQKIDTSNFEAGLAAVVGFYFGARE
jgi:hypothetical protein